MPRAPSSRRRLASLALLVVGARALSAPVSPRPFRLPPHSGYHGTAAPRAYFEGWYLRVTVPERNASFAFIYHVFDPALPASPRHGVGAQLLASLDDGGDGEAVVGLYQTSASTAGFRAAPHDLDVRHAFDAEPNTDFFEARGWARGAFSG